MRLREHPTGAASRVTKCVACALLFTATVWLLPAVASADQIGTAPSTTSATATTTVTAPTTTPPESSVSPPTPPAGAAPMLPGAKAHYDRGLDLYAVRQYPAAIEELRQGFAIEPRREFLFAEAQALRLAGDCQRAIPLYHQFIESDPPPLQMQAAHLGLDRCGPDRSPVPLAPVSPPVREISGPSPPPIQPAPATPSQPPPWWRDPWVDVAVGAGVVALGVATGFEIASRRARDLASAAPNETQYDPLWTSAQHRRQIAVGGLIGGVVLLATGGVRLFFLSRPEAPHPAVRNSQPVFSPMVFGNGAGMMWRGMF